MDIWNYLCECKKPVVLYGTGNGADKIIKVLNSKNIPISGVFASEGFVRNRYFAGFKVKSYNELKSALGDFIILLAFGSSRPEVISNVKKLYAENEFYAPDVPVYGENIFDENFYHKNKRRIEKIYDLLQDDISKKAFENTVKYKLSGNIKYLFECETPEKELFDVLNLNRNECYFDLGAYNGDTIEKFISAKESYNHILAVEPDKKSFCKLKKNTGKYTDITLINACVSNTNGSEEFKMSGGRNSAIGPGGEAKAVTIDRLAEKHTPTFIKFDIEGSELKAICGGKKTISFYKPKMLIAAYHRSEDIFLLPEKVLEINPDYKLYFRHNPSTLSWDSNFIFI